MFQSVEGGATFMRAIGRPFADGELSGRAADPRYDLGPWAMLTLGGGPRSLLPPLLGIDGGPPESLGGNFAQAGARVVALRVACDTLAGRLHADAAATLRALLDELEAHVKGLAAGRLCPGAALTGDGFDTINRVQTLADRAVPPRTVHAVWHRLGGAFGRILDVRLMVNSDWNFCVRPVLSAAREASSASPGRSATLDALAAGLAYEPATEELGRDQFMRHTPGRRPGGPAAREPEILARVRCVYESVLGELFECRTTQTVDTGWGEPEPDEVPVWDAAAWTLSYAGQSSGLINPDTIAGRIVGEFDRRGWARTIDDPNGKAARNKKNHIHQLNSLNPPVCFYGGGTPLGIVWRPRRRGAKPPSGHASKLVTASRRRRMEFAVAVDALTAVLVMTDTGCSSDSRASFTSNPTWQAVSAGQSGGYNQTPRDIPGRHWIQPTVQPKTRTLQLDFGGQTL